MRSIVILGLLVMVVMVSARPRPNPLNHKRPIPCRDEFTNGTVIRVGKECPPPSNCTEGPRNASFADGTVYLRFFCDKPDDHVDKEKNEKELCREAFINGTIISERRCPEPFNCTKSLDSNETENGTEIIKFFCDSTGEERNGTRGGSSGDDDDDDCRDEDDEDEKKNKSDDSSDSDSSDSDSSDSEDKDHKRKRGQKGRRMFGRRMNRKYRGRVFNKFSFRRSRGRGRRQVETPNTEAVTTPKPKCVKCRPEQTLINKWGKPCQVIFNGVEKRDQRIVPCKDQYQCTVVEDKTCKRKGKHVTVKVSYCLPVSSTIQP